MKRILFLTVVLGVALMITVIGFNVNSQERNMQKLNL